ncbi:MAG: YfcE family phosphodiesterase [Erysipelothrix sp.]|jgi:putative phosphoesterase|nr:YfcE family phosphodiesterase [Erysipelothrix sp.]
MKIIITSDVHGHMDRLEKLALIHQDADYFLDAGDSEGNEFMIRPFISVEGNNDRFNTFPKTRVIDCGDVKIYMTHSHEFFTSQRDEGLVKKAKRLGCQIAVYGHSHVPEVKQLHGVTLICPGSLYYNRDRSPIGYVVLNIEHEKISVQHIEYK